MNRGFFKLYRKAFLHKYWTKARVFSEFEAWIDILQSARFAETETTEYIGARSITYGRGQFPASRSYLAMRWTWGENKVRSFLSTLVKDKSIAICNLQGMNIITVCNYSLYNPLDVDENQATSQAGNPFNGMNNSEIHSTRANASTMQTTTAPPAGNHNNKKEKREKKASEERGVREQTKRFVPPTLTEIQDYCLSRNNKVDATKFINFYQSKGWMVGRNRMKDWQASIRMWESSSERESVANITNKYKHPFTTHDNNIEYERF